MNVKHFVLVIWGNPLKYTILFVCHNEPEMEQSSNISRALCTRFKRLITNEAFLKLNTCAGQSIIVP